MGKACRRKNVGTNGSCVKLVQYNWKLAEFKQNIFILGLQCLEYM